MSDQAAVYPEELTRSQPGLFGNSTEYCILTEYQTKVLHILIGMRILHAQLDWRFNYYEGLVVSEEDAILDDYLEHREQLLSSLKKLRYPYKEGEEQHPYYAGRLECFKYQVQQPLFDEEDLDMCPF
ncbi:MAG TPA: hypothetical protein EYN41_02540 [Flavobacteriales bacterium]|nr:hypothetical protein [Flavobacteriales bacterium]